MDSEQVEYFDGRCELFTPIYQVCLKSPPGRGFWSDVSLGKFNAMKQYCKDTGEEPYSFRVVYVKQKSEEMCDER